MPVHTDNKVAEPTQAPQHAIDLVLRAPGQRLDKRTRDFFETRFGHDFSRVRIHTDASAVSSAVALNAKAYTVGNDIVFGQNEYVPGSKPVTSLLAHELAHVAQQRNTCASSPSSLEIGDPSHPAEQEAEAFAHHALLPAARPREPDAPPGPFLFNTPSTPHRVLRRAPQTRTRPEDKTAENCKGAKTWAGCFDTDWYKPTRAEDRSRVRYGADILIRFKPNDKVDAKKIALVQTAQSSEDELPVSIYFRDATSKDDPDVGPRIRGTAERDFGPKAKDTELSRMIDPVEPEGGTGIDSMPNSRTPLAGMRDPDQGSELSDSVPSSDHNLFVKFGSHDREKANPASEDATLRDPPGLIVPRNVEAHQIFETAALAVAGAQSGTFYGSVQWGWRKSSSDDEPKLIEFKLLRQAAPSADFGEAEELWNASKTTQGEPSIGLPLVAEMFVTPKKAALMDGPDKGRVVATLDADTRVEVIDKPDRAQKAWRNVVVTGGRFAGKVGWIEQRSLSDKPADRKRRGPGQK